MTPRLIISSVLVFSAFAAQAQNTQAMQDGLTFGNSIAPVSKGQIVNPAATSAWPASSLPNTIPQGLGTFSNPLDGTSTFSQAKTLGLSAIGNAAMDRCANHTPTGNPEADQECAAVNFLSQRCMTASGAQGQILQSNGGLNGTMVGSTFCEGSFGKDANKFDFANQVKETDNVFDSIKEAQTNAATTTGQTCQHKSVVTRPAQFEQNTCFKSVETDLFTCSQRLQVSCSAGSDGCDAGGVVPNSWAGDMSTSFTSDGAGNFNLTFGTIADNYWGGWGDIYDRNLNFQIKDLGLIKHFTLTRAAFDDWLLVKVNGATVYVGPFGGDRLQIVHYTQYDGEGGQWGAYGVQICETCHPYYPELMTSWDFGLNIDLKPYLTTGANTIFMRTIVAGAGEGAIVISTRQYCPPFCSTSWLNQCSDLENKAGINLGNP
jgi:hypothetical protein